MEKYVKITSEARKNNNEEALLYTPAGDDSIPVKDERLILIKIDGNGKYIIAGVLTPSQGAKPGEKIFFAREPDGDIVSKISMLNDGSVTLDTLTETTDDATGNYNRKIKGETNILEKKDRAYVNEENVNETVKKDKTVLIEGGFTETIKKDKITVVEGNETKEITEDKTESIGGDEKHGIDGSKTENISGDYTLSVSGNLDITVGGNITINGAKISLN
jgi:ribosomal protein L18E